ncbi:MAG: 3'-5' exonuclease [Schwartzia sp. (in: firmicutes)]
MRHSLITKREAAPTDALRKAAAREKQKMERTMRRKALWLAVKPHEIFADTANAVTEEMPVFVSFDLERAGFVEDDIIEIGAVRVDVRDGTFQKFHALVRPRSRLNQHVEKLTGITQAELNGQKTLPEVLPDFLRFVGDAPVLGHAIGDNDIIQINLALRRYRLPGWHKFFPRFVDTEHVAHRLMDHLTPPIKKFGLTFLLARYGLALSAAHRALEDAIASYLLFFLLMRDRALGFSSDNVKFFGTRQETLLSALRETCGIETIAPAADIAP